MEGRIYISSAFTNLKYAACKPNKEWLDNDPHFWKQPPTWGICRTDFRRSCNVGDYIFFVLPKGCGLPQMIYGYMSVQEKISHLEGFRRFPNKRMGNKNPNGNIIVDANGNYNLYDNHVHEERFNGIKEYYIVGNAKRSRMLSEAEIKIKSSSFLKVLKQTFDHRSADIFQIITRKGRRLNQNQVNILLDWLE